MSEKQSSKPDPRFYQLTRSSIRREYHFALEDLNDIAYDFTEGSNARFNDQCAKCQRLRTELINLENNYPSVTKE